VSPRLKVLNLEQARFECVYPSCGGICCKNGRPGVEEAEVERIDQILPAVLPSLRPEARRLIERQGYLSQRRKDGRPMLRVAGGWCVFFSGGCALHKAGAEAGDAFRFKPWRCSAFPLDQRPDGAWVVRQWGVEGEAWDLFCLNPEESPRRAEETLAGERRFVAELEGGGERWRRR
jgi:hypothetical protein